MWDINRENEDKSAQEEGMREGITSVHSQDIIPSGKWNEICVRLKEEQTSAVCCTSNVFLPSTSNVRRKKMVCWMNEGHPEESFVRSAIIMPFSRNKQQQFYNSNQIWEVRKEVEVALFCGLWHQFGLITLASFGETTLLDVIFRKNPFLELLITITSLFGTNFGGNLRKH